MVKNYKLVYINHVLSGNTVYGVYLADVKFSEKDDIECRLLD